MPLQRHWKEFAEVHTKGLNGIMFKWHCGEKEGTFFTAMGLPNRLIAINRI